MGPEEINSLKDLIFTLGEFTGEDWARLEIYMDSPISDEERRTLLDNVLAEIKSADDKEFVLKSLRQLFCADGIIDNKEMPVLDEFTQAVSGVRTDVFSRLSGPHLKKVIQTIIFLFSMTICFILCRSGYQFVASEKEFETVLFGSIKAWYFELIIPLGFFMIGIRFLLRFLYTIFPPHQTVPE